MIPPRFRRVGALGTLAVAATVWAGSPAAAAPPAGSSQEPALSLRRVALGDFDAMGKRRLIRVLVVPSRTHYFVDQGTQHGLAYDAFRIVERDLNAKYRTGALPIRVEFVPVTRDQVIPALLAGRGDIGVGNS